MSPELDKQLCEKYPELFKDRHADKRKTLMCWGFDCGDGWYGIIDDLCHNIMALCLDTNTIVPTVAQVKEKFGGLRFYLDSYSVDMDKAVTDAERISFSTCEVCGTAGKTRSGGWMKTLCDIHHAEREKKRNA